MLAACGPSYSSPQAALAWTNDVDFVTQLASKIIAGESWKANYSLPTIILAYRHLFDFGVWKCGEGMRWFYSCVG